MKPLFILILLITAVTVRGEPPLLLYTADGTPGQGKYVLSRSYQANDKINVSETIVAETLSIQRMGPTCRLSMSNAWLFRTKFGDVDSPRATNSVEQERMFVKLLSKDFAAETKVIYNRSVTPLRQFSFTKARGTNGATRIFR